MHPLRLDSLFMEKNVDTAPFRMAIWYWVLYEKGMVHDDYNYSNWSTLNPKVSNYARLVACMPEDVTDEVCARAQPGAEAAGWGGRVGRGERHWPPPAHPLMWPSPVACEAVSAAVAAPGLCQHGRGLV